MVDAIEYIRPHHGDFIDNKQFKLFEQAAAVGLDFGWIHKARCQTKQRMNGLPLYIECGNAGWSDYGNLFMGILSEVVQKR